jgi:hypothetical protein
MSNAYQPNQIVAEFDRHEAAERAIRALAKEQFDLRGC